MDADRHARDRRARDQQRAQPAGLGGFGERNLETGDDLGGHALNRFAGLVVHVRRRHEPAEGREYLARLHARHAVFARPPGAREGFRHFLRFADTLLDKFLAINGRFKFDQLDIAGHEGMLAASRAGQGAVLVTAHIG